MASTTSTLGDMQLMYTALEICKEYLTVPSSESFDKGPGAFLGQTKQGLALSDIKGMPVELDTPYGRWYLREETADGDWSEYFQAISKELGLIFSRRDGEKTTWSITRWDNKTIEPVEYRKGAERISSDGVKRAWEGVQEIYEKFLPKEATSDEPF